MAKLSPIHPGEILFEDFLDPLGMSPAILAREINVPANRIYQILNGKRSLTADTALRFEKLFGVTAQTWLNLQAQYDLNKTKDSIWSELNNSISPLQRTQRN